MFSKLMGKHKKNKVSARDAMAREQEKDAESKVFALEKKIVDLSCERQTLLKRFEEKVTACARLPKDSYEYKTTRQQALLLRPRISGIEEQIELHAKLLGSNIRYQAMIERGRTTIDLRAYMPDPAKADLLMKELNSEILDTVGDVQAFDEMVGSYDAQLVGIVTPSALEANDEFDTMVQNMQNKQKPDKTAPIQTASADENEPKGELA